MIWRDVVIESSLPVDMIGNALAQTFSVNAAAVTVSPDIEDISDDGVFCQISECPGGTFQLMLSLYLQEEPKQPLETLQKLARYLNSRLVTADDDTADPYAVLLVDPSGSISSARLDADALDEEDIYNLVEQPFSDPVETADRTFKVGVRAGKPCPKDGFWITPAKIGSRRYFKKGEVMPDLLSAYGDSVWQWDPNQDPPRL